MYLEHLHNVYIIIVKMKRIMIVVYLCVFWQLLNVLLRVQRHATAVSDIWNVANIGAISDI